MNILAFYGGIHRNCNVDNPELNWWVHGASATLISDGKYIGSYTEERFTRNKLEGNYPAHSIARLLEKANLSNRDIDIVTYTVSAAGVDWSLNTGNNDAHPNNEYVQFIHKHFPNSKVHYINHHDAHSACTFFASGFEKANVFSFDGGGNYFGRMGENMTCAAFSIVDDYGDTWATVEQGYITRIGSDYDIDVGTFNLGDFYAITSQTAYCMVKGDPGAANREKRDTVDGKIMGLAAYGDASRVPIENPFEVLSGGRSNGMPSITTSSRSYRNLKDALSNAVDPKSDPPSFSGEDLAAWQQTVFQSTLLEFFQKIPPVYLRPDLCLGGGCALNIIANSLIAKLGIYENVFVHPATGDEGLSFGAAMMIANRLGVKVDLPTNIATVGPSYSNEHVREAIESCRDISYIDVADNDLYNIVAEALQENKIVAWFQGCSEYGPRALGNRSIFANPSYDNREVLNTKVKHRESWRPYAAMMLQERLHEWVDIPREMSEYMLFAGWIKSDKTSKVPSIVHEDKSCRIQTVTPELNRRAYRLLEAFNERTGIPMLLNTSFNTIPGEPIVETPYDAIKSFLHSNIDLLVINDFIITKK